MMIYKSSLLKKIIYFLFLVGLSVGCFFSFICDKTATTYDKFFGVFCIAGCLFFVIMLLVSNKVIVDGDKIVYKNPLFKKPIFFWNEVSEVTTFYIIYPETGWITLKSINGAKKLTMPIFADYSYGMVKDILARITPTAKVYLYPYLKRKLEGKQTLFYKDT